jgi:hypothetical protein
LATDYPFIRAYGKLLGAKEHFVDDSVRQARRENVMNDVWSYDAEAKRWNYFFPLEQKVEAGEASPEDVEFVRKIRELLR